MKIKDRVVLGIISGLVGNLGKSTVSKILMEFGFGKKSGRAKALGMFLPKYKLFNKSPKKKLIAFISDYTVAGMLGVIYTYVLFSTGKDYHRFKGLAFGVFTWNSLWGPISRVGATSAYPVSENDNVNGIINHVVYGILTNEVAIRLGDNSLFKSNSIN